MEKEKIKELKGGIFKVAVRTRGKRGPLTRTLLEVHVHCHQYTTISVLRIHRYGTAGR